MHGMLPELLAKAKKLHRAGEVEQAEEVYRQILVYAPSHAETRYLLAGACHAQGRLAEALTLFQETRTLNPGLGECHRNLAVVLQQMGRAGEARTSIQEALRLHPQDAEAYFWLGNFLIEQGHYDDAMDALQTAFRIKPAHFKAHSELGRALQLEGRGAEAIGAFEEALRVQPTDTISLGRLGAALSEAGRIPEAIHRYQEALRIKPGYALALHNLGELVRQGLYRFSDGELAAIKKGSHEQNRSMMDRSLFCFALAYVLESSGDYDEAFAYFRQGNELRKRCFEERGLRFDPQAQASWVERAIGFFTSDYFSRVASYGLQSELPLFIVGMPRSGTTLVEQILASHPEIHGAGELTDIHRISVDLPSTLRSARPYPECLLDCDAAAVQVLGERFLGRLRAKGGSAARVVDKMPDNYLHLGLIATLFPRSRVIFCRRDALDTCLSCYTQSFHATPWAWDLRDIAATYRAQERLVAHWQRVLPVRVFELQYEDLVQSPESVTRRLIDFCGLGWNDQCLTFERNRRPVQTASRLQIQEPIHMRAVGKWKRYERHLGELIEALARTS